MRLKIFLLVGFLLCIMFVFGCTNPRYDYQIVVGSSFNNGDEAAKEAELKVNKLAGEGWEAISIGTGGRAAGIMATREGRVSGGNQIVDVTVLMRRPKK
jgi:hypothetical protein